MTSDAFAIHSFYFAYYGRPADPAGLAFWSAQLERVEGDLGAIAGVFAASEEATVRFGGQDTAARITSVYQQLFNREPDAAGLRYWQEAIDGGHTTLADLTLNILHGARGGDMAIASLRQQAAEPFTASVTSNSVQFTGYAAVEASRALLAAISTTTSQGDMAAMVAKAGKLVDIAHDTPAVIDAIGAGGLLAPLFATARGRAEPENLFHAVVDLAEIAAGNPATLASLLRGGGMNKVLEVMPKNATLHDVVEALASGGLPAAVDVVYPPSHEPTPTPGPVPTPTATGFQDGALTVSGKGKEDALVDIGKHTITIGSGAAFPIGGDGKVTKVVAGDYAGKVTLLGTVAELGVAAPQSPDVAYRIVDAKSAFFEGAAGERKLVDGIADLLDLATAIRVTGPLTAAEYDLLDALPLFDMDTLEATVDDVAPLAGSLRVDGVNLEGSTELTKFTRLDTFSLRVEGAEAGATIGYQMWTRDDPVWRDLASSDQDGFAAGSYRFRAAVTDAAGNVSHTGTVLVNVDRTVPEVSSISYGPNDGRLTLGEAIDITVTFDAPVLVSGVPTLSFANGGSAAYVSGHNYSTLTFRYVPKAGESTAALALASIGALGGAITDRAGNPLAMDAFDGRTIVGAPAVDTVAPMTPSVALAEDTGASATDKLTKNGQVVVGNLETASETRWEFAFDDSNDWKQGGAIGTDGKATLTVTGDGPRAVHVRQYDAAGNMSAEGTLNFTLDSSIPTLTFDQVSGWTGQRNKTSNEQTDAIFKYVGALGAGDTIEYRNDGGDWSSDETIVVGPNTITVTGIDLKDGDPTIELRVTDAAGNVSNVPKVTVDGPWFMPAPIVEATPEGLRVTSLVDADIYLQITRGPQKLVYSDAKAGVPVLLGEQAISANGTVLVKNAAGASAADPQGRYYYLDSATTTIIQPSALFADAFTTWGFGGNDTIYGQNGNDVLYGGAGNDTLLGRGGDDVLVGGIDNNTINGGAGADRIDIGLGANTLQYAPGDSSIANGIDAVDFGNGNLATQKFQFDVNANSGNLVANVSNPSDASDAALLAALAAGYEARNEGDPLIATVVRFQNQDAYLVLDTGDGLIDANDYVIELVGAVPDMRVEMGEVRFGAAA